MSWKRLPARRLRKTHGHALLRTAEKPNHLPNLGNRIARSRAFIRNSVDILINSYMKLGAYHI